MLVFFTLPFVSCGGGDSSSSSSDNGGSGNYISLVGQWEEINVDDKTYTLEKDELTLKEHNDSIWLTKENLLTLDWADADKPIVNKLI